MQGAAGDMARGLRPLDEMPMTRGRSQMTTTHAFSIYLLKAGCNASDALEDNHRLQQIPSPTLGYGSAIYVSNERPTEPWWKQYFKLDLQLLQSSKGALVFFLVSGRYFVLSFGHVYHQLRDRSYEHDFGLRVTLNCVDPNELKSTDTLEPSAARRRRIQLPVGSDLTYFDFDYDSTILKTLTGKVRNEYKDLFTSATGSSSLTVRSDISATNLVGFCSTLLDLYKKDDFRTTFPEIENVMPVRDPDKIALLTDRLVDAMRTRSQNPYLTVPAILEPRQAAYFVEFSGVGTSLRYKDVYIDRYYEYLEAKGHSVEGIDAISLEAHRLKLTDDDGRSPKGWPILKCLLFDTCLDDGTQTFHLADGNWYAVENSYIAKLRTRLDPLCFDLGLPAYRHTDEGSYNAAVADSNTSYVFLDKSNIAPAGQKAVEPCDLYSVEDGIAILYHIKRSTVSTKLSHLFNQGVSSIELIKSEETCMEALKKSISTRAPGNSQDGLFAPLKDSKFRVVYGIVTHRFEKKDQASAILPLFSRISLMRAARSLRMYSADCRFGFIEDQSGKQPGIKKERKLRSDRTHPRSDGIAELTNAS
jgi:uncharacterized protein (TIGR04141 family)